MRKDYSLDPKTSLMQLIIEKTWYFFLELEKDVLASTDSACMTIPSKVTPV